jgi:hypothetical protein
MATLRSVPLLPASAVEHAAAAIARSRTPRGPLSQQEQFEQDRQRCLATWR